jgi:hypothetical protein
MRTSQRNLHHQLLRSGVLISRSSRAGMPLRLARSFCPRLIRNKIYPGMWRVVGPSGTLSDIVNETRAKDVAWYLAESMVSTGTLAA